MGKVMVLLIALAVIFTILISIVEKKLREGERQILAGEQKLADNDKWFVRLFFHRKLADGRQQLANGRKKLTFGRHKRTLLVILCIACIVGVIVILF